MNRTLLLSSAWLFAAAAFAQSPAQTSPDGSLTVFASQTSFPAGQQFYFPLQFQSVDITKTNVVGVTGCTASGLTFQGASPQYASLGTMSPSPMQVAFGPAPAGTYPVQCSVIYGLNGGSSDVNWTMAPIPVTIGSSAPPPTWFGNASTPASSDPISSATGELFGFGERADFDLGGPLPLTLRRYYASFLAINQVTSALGTNWMHNYDIRLTPGATTTVTLFGGKTVSFTKSGSAFQLSGNEKYSYQLASASSGYQFYNPAAQLIYSFDSLGNLTAVADRNGNTLTVTTTSGAPGPSQISDGLGRTLTFTYTGSNLTKVTDQTGRSVVYEYTAGNLTAVTDAAGKRTTYAYTAASLTPASSTIGTAATGGQGADLTVGGGFPGLITAETRPAGNVPYTQQFDSQGRVSRQTDSQGNTMTLVYNTGSTLRTEAQGVTFTDTYDKSLNLVSESFWSGNLSKYAFDSHMRLTGSTDRTGATTAVTYDAASGWPASYTDTLGNVTTFTYAASTQGGFTFYDVASIARGQGTTTFTRDSNGNVTSRTEASGQSRKTTYNSHGQPLTETNPAGGVTTYTYGSDGSLASVQLPSGDVTKYGYDSAGRRNLVTYPDGAASSVQYDAANRVTRRTDELSNSTNLTWDGNGNLTALSDPLSATTGIAYDGNDRAVAVTNPLGKTARRTFDQVARLGTVTDETGVAVSYRYNTQNQVEGITDAAGQTWRFTRDGENRLLGLTDPLSRTTTITRNAAGLVTTFQTPNKETYSFTYDGGGNLASVTDPLNQVTRLRGGPGGLGGRTYPDGTSESWQRNALGLVTAYTDRDGNVTQFAWDNGGRLTKRTDPLGRSWSYTYDSRQRVAAVAFPQGSVTYTYDAAGNLTQASYSDGTVLRYGYDARRRLTTADHVSIQYDAAGRIAKYNNFAIGHDDAGRLSSITYAPGQVVRYVYNNVGMLSEIDDWAGGRTLFTYDAARQLTARTMANGTREDYTYDADGRPLTLKVSQGSKILLSETVKRDALGRIVSDDFGGFPLPDPAGYVSQQFDAAGQSFAATYDGNGFMTGDPLHSFQWNLAGKLTSYTGMDTSAQLTYDGLGRVLTRTPLAGATPGSNGPAAPPAAGDNYTATINWGDGAPLQSDGFSVIPVNLSGGSPPAAAVGPTGNPLAVTTTIGGNFVVFIGSAGFNGYIFAPVNFQTAINGNVPRTVGTTYPDPIGVNIGSGDPRGFGMLSAYNTVLGTPAAAPGVPDPFPPMAQDWEREVLKQIVSDVAAAAVSRRGSAGQGPGLGFDSSLSEAIRQTYLSDSGPRFDSDPALSNDIHETFLGDVLKMPHISKSPVMSRSYVRSCPQSTPATGLLDFPLILRTGDPARTYPVLSGIRRWGDYMIGPRQSDGCSCSPKQGFVLPFGGGSSAWNTRR